MATKSTTSTRGALARVCLLAVTLAVPSAIAVHDHNAFATPESEPVTPTLPAAAPPRRVTITYRAHDGRTRKALLLLPHGYGPGNNPRIPLVISPHGRGVDGALNSRLWGNLPTIGGFAVVNPDGEGRVLHLHSWGAAGQISDLARMPKIVSSRLPWVKIDSSRIYAVGGSMGGQETLLLVGKYPNLLAGAVAVDSLVDFPRQYRNFPRLECDSKCLAAWGRIGLGMQRLAQREVGGTPTSAPAAYAARSPLMYVGAIAESCVPLQIWWSRKDRVVMESPKQSGALFRAMARMNPAAPVDEYVGTWIHTHALNEKTRLPMMLAGLGLLPSTFAGSYPSLEHRSAGPLVGCGKQ
jgi:pimeloyl-ACP methyl ester carboxylesterase